MIIGSFRDHRNGSYTGRIMSVLFANKEISIGDNPNKKKKSEPDLIIHCFLGTPVTAFDIGAAWRRKNRAGEEYLSVKLDSPGLAEPIFARLSYPIQGQPEMRLEWIRGRKLGSESTVEFVDIEGA